MEPAVEQAAASSPAVAAPAGKTPPAIGTAALAAPAKKTIEWRIFAMPCVLSVMAAKFASGPPRRTAGAANLPRPSLTLAGVFSRD